MKKFLNIYKVFVVLLIILVLSVCFVYKYNLMPVNNDKTIIEVEIPKGSIKNIAKVLKEKNLIKNEKFFVFYTKLTKKNNLQAGFYKLSKNMGVEKIVDELVKGSKINPNEISVTFKEGITMRDIAKVISSNTNNSYESVIEKSNDINYINSLKNKYWFITDSINNDNLYYKLEGYLFPDTYRFNNKNVSVSEIFDKMILRMNDILTPLKDDILKSGLNVHEILTLSSMIEKESYNNIEYKKNISSVFLNRIKLKMSLGSDVTTRYALKIDDNTKALSKADFQTQSLYNTRLTNGLMNGKLPVGPISTVSSDSIKAAVYPNDTKYIYFIANIKTKETFFYEYSSDFEKKKNELKNINGGL